jgi:hypothetical protein
MRTRLCNGIRVVHRYDLCSAIPVDLLAVLWAGAPGLHQKRALALLRLPKLLR